MYPINDSNCMPNDNVAPLHTTAGHIPGASESRIQSNWFSTVGGVEVVTLRLPFAKPRVRSFCFNGGGSQQTSGPNPFEFAAAKPTHAQAAPAAASSAPVIPAIATATAADNQAPVHHKETRIRPPRDMIKLADRLFVTLQPPLESLLKQSTVNFPFPPFEHQIAGIAFLFPRHVALLADEMGLGKTMQCITTIRLLLRSGQLRSVLLVCPKPLVTNWQREFAMWAPEIPICAIQGDQAKRSWQWLNVEFPVKIANYELMTRDSRLIAQQQREFDLVVLDEAQRIKNRHGATHQAVCSLGRKRSWALTGTPVENSTHDLVGIFEFLSTGYLNVDMTPLQMRKAVRDYILRRTKSEVMKDMPPLLHRDGLLDLTAQQWSSYEQAETQGVIQLNQLGDQITIHHVFELVLRLKQICNFDPVTGASAKMERLQAELEEVLASGQKAIVFSQWVKTLEQIAHRLPEAQPLAFHGKIPPKQRDHVLAEFQHNPQRHVLLMSYGAGSVGLNLQFCRYVFLFDQWWNPAVEDQAINRAHRIGGSGSVTVTRLISKETIEERINRVLEDKRELFHQIISNTEHPRRIGMSKEEIFGLFDLRAGGQRINGLTDVA